MTEASRQPARAPAQGDSQLYDLLLIGLTFMREANSDVLARPANSIFSAMRHTGLITEAQRRTLSRNFRLIGQVQTNSLIRHELRMPPRRKVVELIESAEKHLLLFVVPDKGSTERVLLQHNRIIGPGGYTLIVTEAGMAYARRVVGQFSELLNPEKFAAGWRRFRVEARRLGVDRRSAASGGISAEVTVSEDEARVHIDREAKYTEADFDW
jgi:hypothetical protein